MKSLKVIVGQFLCLGEVHERLVGVRDKGSLERFEGCPFCAFQEVQRMIYIGSVMVTRDGKFEPKGDDFELIFIPICYPLNAGHV